MEPRLDYQKILSPAIKLMLQIEEHLRKCGLDERLLHLVKMRASQINGCAFCIDMHSLDARAAGESEQRLYALSAWRETPFFSDRERAALEWTEAVTLVSHGNVPDAVYELARQQFNAEELANLTLALTNLNAWNRVNIAFRTLPGNYKPGMFRSGH